MHRGFAQRRILPRPHTLNPGFAPPSSALCGIADAAAYSDARSSSRGSCRLATLLLGRSGTRSRRPLLLVLIPCPLRGTTDLGRSQPRDAAAPTAHDITMAARHSSAGRAPAAAQSMHLDSRERLNQHHHRVLPLRLPHTSSSSSCCRSAPAVALTQGAVGISRRGQSPLPAAPPAAAAPPPPAAAARPPPPSPASATRRHPPGKNGRSRREHTRHDSSRQLCPTPCRARGNARRCRKRAWAGA